MIVVVMAGGSGTRFWPRSRESEPKQFLPLLGPESMLARTVARVAPLASPERVLVVTGAPFVDRTRRELPDLPPENVIGEPVGRNTAPCVALAAARAAARYGNEEVMAMLPADHHIEGEERFRELLSAGADFCRGEGETLLTLGVRPDRPETGYGYLEMGEEIRGGGVPVRRVNRFIEKPDRKRAEEYVRSGRHLWNSGMFLWRVDAITNAILRHMPELEEPMRLFRGAAEKDLSSVLESVYEDLPDLSIDYGVMEKAERVAAIAADFRWNDVGSWSALGDLIDADAEGNAAVGGHLGIDSRRCVVYSSGRLIATVGVDDLIVVETDGAVLVCPRDRAQDVRLVVERLRREGRRDLL
ncbi:MAG: mannose-1-phosphate guanylyltransferase [Candidatus Eisenbacteria bacterium]|nr:mannose-1-phosphate guanylyltransferase [Candidatus Eisenbacteria bacterium]